MQVIRSKIYGEVSFEKTFVMGMVHVGKLAGGGYAHVSGHALTSKDEGLAAIPPGKEQAEFLQWWVNKDRVPEEAIMRRIIVNPDGSYSFDDGESIEKAEDLIKYFGSGDALEQALRWFAGELVRRAEVEKAMGTKAGSMAVASKNQVPGKAKKGPAPKITGRPATEPPMQSTEPEVAIKE